MAEMTKVHYKNVHGYEQVWDRQWSPVEGGIILHVTANTQFFVPMHKVDGIEQTFTNDHDPQEKYNKSLFTRLYKPNR